MGSVDAKDFREATCDRNTCWARESFEDAGITVEMGAGWNAFLIETHFSNKHKCLSKNAGRKGNFCDAIAVPDQNPNCRFRLIEAKAGGMSSNAKRQLQNGADFLQSVIGKCPRIRLTAQLYTRDLPSVTNKRRTFVEFNDAKIRVPVEILAV
jgi:hypothetical protein